MQVFDSLFTIYILQHLDAITYASFGLVESWVGNRNSGVSYFIGEIVPDCVWYHEIAVGESLHERGGPEAVCPVIAEVTFSQCIQPGNGGHQIVVDPQPAHCIVYRRIYSHRRSVRIISGDLLVH